MYCNRCGKKISNDSEYCKYCGSPQYDGYFDEEEERLFPFGIIVFAFISVIAIIFIVVFKPFDGMFNQATVAASSEAPYPPEETSDIVGSYSATSAVYNDMNLNSLMLQLSGYAITFEVYEDNSFSASINDSYYEGTWYQDGSYVEFYSGDLSMTGEYSNGVISVSDEALGLSVVLEK
jgi:hypothetical protein